MSAADRVQRDRGRIDEWIRYAATSGESPAIDAATVVVLRDGDEGLETLMLRRNSKIAFGGMWVFPGGRVDDTDRLTAAAARRRRRPGVDRRTSVRTSRSRRRPATLTGPRAASSSSPSRRRPGCRWR